MIIAFLLQQIGVDKNDIPDISYVSYYCTLSYSQTFVLSCMHIYGLVASV